MASLPHAPEKGDVKMGSLSIEDKIATLAELGSYINEFDDRLKAYMHRSVSINPWFTIENQEYALKEIANQFLDSRLLRNWITGYEMHDDKFINVGVIVAGNIPLVGFHDVLSVFISGNVAQIKISERDPHLLPFFLKKMGEINPNTKAYFSIADRLSGFDAVIATGSNNSARYFEQYFGKYPHIIRKNRNGVAVLTGNETMDELKALANDVFQYYGLGCRNVTHIFVPEDYDFDAMSKAFKTHLDIVNHTKYKNNFDHNLAILILNRIAYLNIEHVLLVEDDYIISPIACLYYSRYADQDKLQIELNSKVDEIQCVVSNVDFHEIPTVPFGEAQRPSLTDYADGLDTMLFLTSL
jgi:acyl-CoA reductase LuxC